MSFSLTSIALPSRQMKTMLATHQSPNDGLVPENRNVMSSKCCNWPPDITTSVTNSSEVWDASDTPLQYACSSGSQAKVFIEDDASVVNSSCHFSLTGIGRAPPHYDTIFGHRHRQQQNLEYQKNHASSVVSKAFTTNGRSYTPQQAQTPVYWPGDHHRYQSEPDRQAAEKRLDEGTEVSVLHHLGATMSKLDMGTRLSIRNALYRLAKGAAHRSESFSTANANDVNLRFRDEVCTNAVDRTVASLLFYRDDSQQQQQPPQKRRSVAVPPRQCTDYYYHHPKA